MFVRRSAGSQACLAPDLIKGSSAQLMDDGTRGNAHFIPSCCVVAAGSWRPEQHLSLRPAGSGAA